MLVKIIKGVLIVWCGLNCFGELKLALGSDFRNGIMRFWDLFWTICYILVILFLTGVLK